MMNRIHRTGIPPIFQIALFFVIAGLTLRMVIVLENPGSAYAPEKRAKVRGAMGALDFWMDQRAFPFRDIPAAKYFEEYRSYLNQNRNAFLKPTGDTWEPIGPTNVGGRTLAIAIDPTNPRVMYAGAASGGLWKSVTGGEGANAWSYVPTGYPSLSVNTIAINPFNTSEILIGTGEVYQYRNSIGGHFIRTTRGSYGIGILRTTDGGLTWEKSLDWTLEQQTGVMQISFNPLNPRSVYAATSEGLFKSVDGGDSWRNIHGVEMTNTVVVFPEDTTVVMITCGNLDSTPLGSGVYRSTDAGRSFARLTQGLPASWSGRATLTLSPAEPGTVFAGISEAFSTKGIFKSTSFGTSWTALADSDYCTYQGWYSNVLAVHPVTPDILYACGVYLWRSTDGGQTLARLNANYHVDFHCAAFHPIHPDTIYFGTDGGVYRGTTGGSFRSLNGGYQTTQFYAGFSNAPDDSTIAMGGLQDNGTVKYTGNAGTWQSIFGGDGCWTAFDPRNSDTLYAEYQWLNMVRSFDGGRNWNRITSGINMNDDIAFVGPFVVLPSAPNTLFCGTHKMYKSTNMGGNWQVTNNDVGLSNNPVITIAATRHSADTLYAATVPTDLIRSGVFATFDGGGVWGAHPWEIPNRFIMDIAIHPILSSTLYIAVSGFGSDHVYKSVDGGDTWKASGAGLPDVPTQAVMVDPFNPAIVYVGNDIGMFVSTNDGVSWRAFNDGLPPCTVADITFSPVNRKIRIATHGNGVWERSPLGLISSVKQSPRPVRITLDPIYPNPFRDNGTGLVRARVGLPATQSGVLQLVTANGNILRSIDLERGGIETEYAFPMKHLPSGTYLIRMLSGGESRAQKFIWIK